MADFSRLHVIQVVPDASPNAESITVQVPAEVDLRGKWEEVAQRCRPYIPKEHHMVMIGPKVHPLVITSGGTEDAPISNPDGTGYLPS